jgi:RNA polymerase sigma-70 factor (ECF subfamily)
VDGQASFEQAATELIGPVTGYLRRMLGNAADADDLLQETLLRIARALPDLEERAVLKTWAFRIAHNVAVDHLRKTKRATFVELDDQPEAVDHEEEEGRLIIGEMNACIRGVIDSLPPEYRSPLVLSQLEGRSVAEVADICSLSIGAAKVRIHRAKARLRDALNRQCIIREGPGGGVSCEPKRS